MYQKGRIWISKDVFLQNLRRIWPELHIGKKSGKKSTLLGSFKISFRFSAWENSNLHQFCDLQSIIIIVDIDRQNRLIRKKNYKTEEINIICSYKIQCKDMLHCSVQWPEIDENVQYI